MRCYYAHCIALYNTPQEERDMDLLLSFGWEVHNPNTEEAQRRYIEIKASGGDAMGMFEAIVRSNDILAFRALPDGSIPSGVHKEIKWAIEGRLDIIELPNGLLRRGLTYELTKEYLADIGER